MAHERILVVDDSEKIRDLLANHILAAEGYDTYTAENGRKGFALAQEIHPDLIITDHLMPEMTGLDLLNALNEIGVDVPVILITAEGSESLAVSALRGGVYDYLIKPFGANEILDSVRNVMSRYWASQIRKREPAHLLEANRVLETRIREMATLVEIGKGVTSMLDVQQVLDQVVTAAVDVTGAEASSLMLVDFPLNELYIRAARNFGAQTIYTLRLAIDDSLAGQVVQSGVPLVYNENALTEITPDYSIKSVVYVPLRVQQQVIGVLSVDNREIENAFDSHHIQVLSILADFAAVALENSRLYAETVQERNTLDAILRDTEDHVIVVDTEDNVLFCNPVARRTFNVTLADFIGKPLHDVIENAEVQALFSKQALIGRGRRSEITLNGGDRVLQAQLTIIDGVGRSAVMQDITHLKQADRAKSDFVTTVSHDLRSPLTAILAYTELMGRVGSFNEQQEQFAGQITASVKSINQLIVELLELGRIEGGYDIDRESIDLRETARTTIANLSHQLNEQGHTLDVNFAPDLPSVHGNPLRLGQVLTNLLGNAIKYTPAGGCIKLSVEPDGNMVVLQVSDNGIGIPLDDQPYVFDKFFRSARVTEYIEGTGLGLSITKSIVDQHLGRIWLESREGGGTTFTVVLPAEESVI